MRRPQATTVSAASTSAPGSCFPTAAAFSIAVRSAYSRGNSCFSGVSSTSAATMRAGTIPACASSAARLGLALARTSGWGCAAATRVALRLFETVGDAALGQVIGRHLDQNLVADQHADAVLAHFARGMGDDLMFVLELHPIGR